MLRNFLFVAAIAAFTTHAHAGVVGSLLSFNGSPDIIVDDSAGLLLDGGDGTLDVGDQVIGVIELSKFDGNDVPSGQSVLGLYAFEVDTISASSITMKAGDLASLLTTAGVDTSGLVAYGGGPSDAAFAIIEATDGKLGIEDIDSSFSQIAAQDFRAVITAGFDTVDDFHKVTAEGLTNLTASGGIKTASASGLFGGSSFGSFDGLYSVSAHAFGTGTIFLSQEVLKLDNSVFPPTVTDLGDAQIYIVGGNLNYSDATAADNGWHFQDDGNYNINTVPEPASLGIFAVIGVAGLARRHRRNGKA